jgi:large subunit ribosomal protein L15
MANPEKHPELAHHKLADPTSRKDREYYRDPAKRGYLAGTLKEGEVPNLYFKNREIGVDSLEEKAKKVDTSANRLF